MSPQKELLWGLWVIMGLTVQRICVQCRPKVSLDALRGAKLRLLNPKLLNPKPLKIRIGFGASHTITLIRSPKEDVHRLVILQAHNSELLLF